MNKISLSITCPHCGHVRDETLQRAVDGHIFPLHCVGCGRPLEIDWEWIEEQGKAQGLIPQEDGPTHPD